MGSIFDKFRQFNQPKGGIHVKKSIPSVVVVLDEAPLDLEVEIRDPDFPQVMIDDLPENVKSRIRVLMDQEAHLRNQREKYRMNYYVLEKAKAPSEDFKKNYAIIAQFTRDLAPVYLERKKIELEGRVETKVELTSEQELHFSKLKNQKRKLIDKKSKLAAKISNYLGFANGQTNLHKWEQQHAETELGIYEIEEEIKRMQGCQD